MFDWLDHDNDLLNFISQLSNGKNLIIGISDPKQPQLDALDNIKIILDKVYNANPQVGINISTKGGFVNNTDSIDFSSITEADQWSKIANLLKL